MWNLSSIGQSLRRCQLIFIRKSLRAEDISLALALPAAVVIEFGQKLRSEMWEVVRIVFRNLIALFWRQHLWGVAEECLRVVVCDILDVIREPFKACEAYYLRLQHFIGFLESLKFSHLFLGSQVFFLILRVAVKLANLEDWILIGVNILGSTAEDEAVVDLLRQNNLNVWLFILHWEVAFILHFQLHTVLLFQEGRRIERVVPLLFEEAAPFLGVVRMKVQLLLVSVLYPPQRPRLAPSALNYIFLHRR